MTEETIVHPHARGRSEHPAHERTQEAAATARAPAKTATAHPGSHARSSATEGTKQRDQKPRSDPHNYERDQP